MDYKEFNEKFPLSEKCWKGYKQLGMKDKDGKQVPNCVPENKEESKNDKTKVELNPKIDENIS